ncbi:MAG TPA: N-formylglutamate deformylase [Povalibacter sp.]|uniref:N-formylglutamate deformylase n=1 Tax=Povalibacter sp. TaxID=1962978 RepID=UPI002C0EF97E|nr:N-formylglutamate deformylase [Povalibacter sp.]HMN43735.1 N-formylglutamate deformylase [Povalibacter sp.]
MQSYRFHRGPQPLLISVPHAGTSVPEEIAQRFTAAGRALPDTDWYVDRLYDFAAGLGASIVTATYSRYVVDLNRSPDSAALYVASPTSPVCALQTFDGESIYRSGAEPDAAEVADRIERYWHPYHQCIAEELWRIRSEHGHALLWDAHSIASRVPELFDGELPEFNFGTRDHAACPEHVSQALLHSILEEGQHSAVLNGRFKGGYVTLAYGRPADRIWAMQLELAQRTYMDEPVRAWEPGRAAAAAARISSLLERFMKLASD